MYFRETIFLFSCVTIFMHSIMDNLGEGGLKSTGNTMTVRKKSSGTLYRERLQKFQLNLELLYVSRPWKAYAVLYHSTV